MKVFQYRDYNHYVEAQTITNKEKVNWVYVFEKTVEEICKHSPNARSVICHGTRNGAEQKMFKKYLDNPYVIGTEISDNAYQFAHTIQWDFTKPKLEWKDKFDIVYSNSFDHTIDPKQTLYTWYDQLTKDGVMYLEYAESQSIGNDADPLQATLKEIEELILKCDFKIVDRITQCKNGGVVLCCSK